MGRLLAGLSLPAVELWTLYRPRENFSKSKLSHLLMIADAKMGSVYREDGPPVPSAKEKAGSAVGQDRGLDLSHRLHPIKGVSYLAKRVCTGDQVPEGELAKLEKLERLVKMPPSP